MICRRIHRYYLEYKYRHNGKKTDQEHRRSQKTEYVHRLYAEFRLKPEGSEVEVSVDESVETEFGVTVFACLMVHYLFSDFFISRILCQIWDIPVHVAVYLYMLHHIVAVCLESAVEVMQILYTADLAGCRIEQLCGNS